MKKIFIALLLSSLSSAAWAESAKFVRLQADQASYSVGSRALVFAYIDRLPTEATKEFFVRAKVGGDTVNMIPLSDHLMVAMPNRFQAPRTYALESLVMVQDKSEQLSLEQSWVTYEANIDSLKEQLRHEHDTEHRAALESAIAQEQAKADTIRARIENNRTLVETSGISLAVTNDTRRGALASVLSISADHSPATYSVGQNANFTVHLNTRFAGPEGDKEHVVRGKIGATDIEPVVTGDDFLFTTANFVSGDIGSKNFQSTLFIRPQAQGDILRSSIPIAEAKRDELIEKYNAATNIGEKNYYGIKISEVNAVITALQSQLEESLTAVESGTFAFTVTGAAK